MEALFPALAVTGTVIALGALFYGLFKWDQRRREQIKRERTQLAERLGLRYRTGGWATPPAVLGEIDGWQVSASFVVRSTGKVVWYETIYELSGLQPSIELRAESLATGVRKTFGAGELRTGDEAWDASVFFRGDELDAAILSDRDLRDAVRVLTDGGWRIGGGKMAFVIRQWDPSEVVEERVRRMVSVASAIRAARASFPKDDDALLEMLRDHAAPFARRTEALIRLMRSRSAATKLAGTEASLLQLLGSDAAATHVAAAKALGEHGTIAAVEKLLPLTRGLFGDGDVKIAATAAVRSIQARAEGASAGQLSVSDAESRGEVSLAERGGAISIAKKTTT